MAGQGAIRPRVLSRILLSLVLGALATSAPLGGEHARSGETAMVVPVGRLLIPRGFNLNLVDQASGMEEPLHTTSQVVLGVAWSPDGTRVAFAQLTKEPGDSYPKPAVYVLEDGQVRRAVGRVDLDEELANPVWMADGRGLIFEAVDASGMPSLEQMTFERPLRKTLERGAAWPAVSPDGSRMAFVRVPDVGVPPDTLIVRRLDAGDVLEVVPPGVFAGIASPRFSPDGHRLAFMAITGSANGRDPDAEGLPSMLQLGASVARAHGQPWDPWIVNVDGGGLRQVAALGEDDPSMAWSPDGSTLAVLGGGGLWLLPSDGNSTPVRLGQPAYGTIDWGR